MSVVTRLGANAGQSNTQAAIVEAGCLSMDTQLIALFTIDPYSGSVECDGSDGVSDDIKQAFLRLYDTRMTDLTVTDGWVTDVKAPDVFNAEALDALSKAGVTWLAACPIRSDFSTCGALVAFYTEPLTRPQETLYMLEMLTAHVTTVLSYAASLAQSQTLVEGLYGENQELSHQASVDSLTSLPNHRAFRETLENLCRKALGKQGRPLSLVMIDVDHFKIYNDTYGHPEGDTVLKKVAKLMSAGLRQNDFAARYGGEEFAIVFSGANKDSASIAAERIRKSIAEYTFDKGSTTVSMGIAEYPHDTSDPAELIELADKALYHAKSTGRNRVYRWGAAGSASSIGESAFAAGSQEICILVVESPEETCAVEVRSAMPAPCTIISAPTIEEALETLKSRVFDIAFVSNAVLPDHNTRHLSTLAAIHTHMPIVLVADNMPAQESRDALRRGASDILLRPYNPAGFPVLVERNLERQRLELQRLMQKSTGVMLQAIDALVSAVDAKDHNTAGHSHRVAELTMSISNRLGISNEERYALELASKLHDIGKIALPDSALNKPSALSDEEWQAMRQHPIVGAKIVGTISELAYVSTIIRHHHERLDGSGYPDGLSGPAIPYLSQIIAVADSYEAMTAKRAYRTSLTPSQAIAELKQDSGTLYDPEIVDTLEKQLLSQGEMVSQSLKDKAA